MNLARKTRALSTIAALTWQERLSPDRVEQQQERKLRRILRCAQQLPYYRGLFAAHSIDVSNCTREDLRRLPTLTREVYRDLVASRPADEKQHYLLTSGSSGKPLAVPMTARTGAISQALFRYASWKSGVGPADRICYFTVEPECVEPTTLLQKAGLGRQLNLSILNEVRHNIARILQLRPQVLYSLPSYLILLASYVESERLALPFVRLILTGGETLSPATREHLQNAFGATVRDQYGSTEFNRLAYECTNHCLHLIPYAAIVEVVNVDSHGMGDALITSLYHEAVPFVRYEIGDRIQLSSAVCDCGARSQTIQRIEGRSNDLFVLPSGRRISWRSVAQYKDVPGILEHQLIQKRRDYFEVHVRVNGQFSPESAALIHKRVRDVCHGESVHVEIVVRDTLVRGRTGKLRAAICEVPES